MVSQKNKRSYCTNIQTQLGVVFVLFGIATRKLTTIKRISEIAFVIVPGLKQQNGQ